jgi:hypothetical protein
MRNLKTNFNKMLDMCIQLRKEFTNEQGNIPQPRFGDSVFS